MATPPVCPRATTDTKQLKYMKRIAIFASGSGTNAEAIARHLAGNKDIEVACVLSNRANAGVHQRMEQFGIPTHTFAKEVWSEAHPIVEVLQMEQIDLVVLAGFMRKIESPLTTAYAGRIVNIHPSLLPLHGGPGMYGHHVHEAVLAAGDTESGITIHYVDEQIDGGEIIFQARCEVRPDDTPDTLADRIHVLEHRHFPQVIEELLTR